MFGKRAKQLGVDAASARRSPAPDAAQSYGPGLPRVPSTSASARDAREAQQFDDSQVRAHDPAPGLASARGWDKKR
jgi:hypothetical protein